MILTLYITLLILTGAFIIIGKVFNSPPTEVIGYCFLFILGLVLMLGSVVYQTGETKQVTDVSVYNGTVVGVDTQTNITFSNYSGEVLMGIQLHHFFGLFISFAASFAFLNFYLNFKGDEI